MTALKLGRTVKSLPKVCDRVCRSCGQILIFGKTKRIRFKTRMRRRNFSISMLARFIHKTKRKKKLNFSVETCLYCKHRKYGVGSFTSLWSLQRQRLKKLKMSRSKRQVSNLKRNFQSDEMKLESKRVGLKTVANFKKFSKGRVRVGEADDAQGRQSEMARLLDLNSSSNTRGKLSGKRQKKSISKSVNVKFKSKRRSKKR